MQALTPIEIQSLLSQQPHWQLRDGKLTREWLFKDFLAAMAFVNQVAELAEQAAHHPDIDIRYNRVQLSLVTHDAGGITQRDAAMAATLTQNFPA